MGSITGEEGVLKLVRPGRRVEVHKEPITAGEVMKKYPRHCITRPDIFEFPWIVVKPEAVLNLGRVFFIVPNRTIYQLLKARENDDQSSSSSSQQRQSAKDHGHHQVSEVISPPKVFAGVTPKHHEQRRRLKNQFFSCATVSPSDEEGDSDKGLQKDSQVGAWPELPSTKKRTHRRSRYGSEHDHINKRITTKLADLKLKDSNPAILLKSCLRKPESARKSLHLTVVFVLPNKDEEQQCKAPDSQMQLQGSLPGHSLDRVFVC